MERLFKLFCSLLALVLVLASIVSCSDRAVTPSYEFSSWIRAFSGGVLKSDSSVKVLFSCEVPGDRMNSMSQEELDALFSFTPRLAGSVRFVGNDAVEFIPEAGELSAGEKYRAVFHLERLFDVPGRYFKEFVFSFAVAPRTAKVELDGVSISASSPDKAKVSGRIFFNEDVSTENASDMLMCTINGRTVRPEMCGGINGRTVEFSLGDIVLGEHDMKAVFTFNGESEGFPKLDPSSLIIPSRSVFKIIGVKSKDSRSPYVEVRFSAPLDRKYDPDGLFELLGAGRNYLEIDGNSVKIYYEKTGSGRLTLNVSEGVRSEDGRRLQEPYSESLESVMEKPSVKIESEGTIVPDARRFFLPVSTVNLSAIDVSVVKIYESNILSFLQDNDITDDSQLRRFGRLVCRKTVRLDSDPSVNLHIRQRFNLDLSDLLKEEPGAIYRVRLSFRQEYSLYGNEHEAAGQGEQYGGSGIIPLMPSGISQEEEMVWDEPSPYYYENYYDWDKYDWREADNPMHPTYYMQAERFPSCNLMASNIGLMAKSSGNGVLWVYVNDILSAGPLKGASVSVYNYQLQKIGEQKTDSKGMAEVKLSGKPFALTAVSGESSGFLKVVEGKENPMSRFDVGGQDTEDGIKAYIYGERGVWRPGDTLHVSMIVDGGRSSLPDTHPVIMELYAPQGQFYNRITSSKGKGGFYTFTVPTAKDDPTGIWNAYFKVGGSTFHKSLMIETVKPNRLKMRLVPEDKVLMGGKMTDFDLSASWLSGPVASGLPAIVEMSVGDAGRYFEGYENYVFADPAGSKHGGDVSVLFKAVLDKDGKTHARVCMPEYKGAPGMMRANLVTRISEPGGDESISSESLLYSPYDVYVGVGVPENKDYLETDIDHVFPVIALDSNGRPVKGRRLEYKIFKTEWSWWWESDPEKIRSYVNGTSAQVYGSGMLVSGAEPAKIPFRVNYPDWGRYLVYVKDLDGGHAAGFTVLADWPAYRGRSLKVDPDAETMLAFSTDKKEYVPGEYAIAFIPAAKDGMALVSLESDDRVISSEWVRTSEKEDLPYKFKITEEMAPNFYVHVTLLQKYGNTANDLPVRMYGVQPVSVRNEATHLYPQIKMKDVVRPLEEFEVRVSERNGRDMVYTLAIVDEGLLDLTAFKTPDPWSSIYAKEALGVRTWDVYDDVAGAFSGEFVRMYGIGGDRAIDKSARQDNRFNPVVRFIGPFTLSGKENIHKIKLPMYVGSVRVMLVAGKEGAYGNAEKTVPVRAPLMVLPTLPPALGHGETVYLPVNVFAMEEEVRDVSVSVNVKGPVKVISESSQIIKFGGKGDRLVKFKLQALSSDGDAEVTVTALGGGYSAKEKIVLPVRNFNIPVSLSRYAAIGSGESKVWEYDPFKSGSGNSAKIELSGFPAIDINGCFSYIAGYQYDCSEQIASRGIALLALKPLLSEQMAEQVNKLVPELLSSIYARQLPDGGFAYWPGDTSADEWVSSMAGQFIHTAASAGYEVNKGVFSSWLNFQKRCVRNYRSSAKGEGYFSLVQAYRLYTLALASAPETGAMNRLKESGEVSVQALWRLAAAYAVSGKKNIAAEMVSSLKQEAKGYDFQRYGYDSPFRNKAMILETMILADDIAGAMAMASEVADELSGSNTFNTQTAAFSAVALEKLSEKMNTGIIEARISQSSNGKAQEIKSAVPVSEYELDPEKGMLKVENKSEGPLYAVFSIRKTMPFGDYVPAHSDGLKINVLWKDISGNSLDCRNIRQGTDFVADISVSNTSVTEDYENLALVFPVASGWEIFNERAVSGYGLAGGDPYSYKDVRDNKVIFYFDLQSGKTKTFRVRLRAAYEGEFVLPATECENMYDPSISAGTGTNCKVSVKG